MMLATVGSVTTLSILRIEVNGHAATVEELAFPALVNYGHFTTMQVRDAKVRGLDLHLKRLDTANRELYGTGLDDRRVRDHIRHALGDDTNSSVRVTVFWPEADDRASIMVSVRPPAEMPSTPHSLRAVEYQRPVPHLKHSGSFGQIHYGNLAERDGFDDALLTGPGGVVSETTIANLGCYDGTSVVWPDAPSLHGITMQLIESVLADRDLPSRRSQVRLGDLASFDTVFLTNSGGIAPVGRVDDLPLPVDTDFMKTVAEAYQSVRWDPI